MTKDSRISSSLLEDEAKYEKSLEEQEARHKNFIKPGHPDMTR